MRNRFVRETCTAMCIASMSIPSFAGSASVSVTIDNGCGVAGPTSGQINGSGATLFVPFFRAINSTHDDLPDSDGDGCAGFNPLADQCGNPLTPCPIVDQLAADYISGQASLTTHWAFQYRSVGSVNGYNEFIDSQLCGILSTSVPSEAGLLNRGEWAVGGVKNPAVSPGADCLTPLASPPWPARRGDTPGDGDPMNDGGTPLCIQDIHFSFLDVPSRWGSAVPTPGPDQRADAAWDREPGEPGYGFNPVLSNDGWDSRLASLGRSATCQPSESLSDPRLNVNVLSPDANTIFDTKVAWVVVSYNVNQGVGKSNFNMTDLQHLFTTGRSKTGENLAAVTRSAGSGTRNAIMNTSGIDSSWGRGDNINLEWPVTNAAHLGPNRRVSNGEGSSNVERALHVSRLGVGYTGLFGTDRTIVDVNAGDYEVANVKFDDRGGTQYVRPSITAIVDNCDPNTGYQIGGEGTFVTRGNPLQTNTSAPDYMGAERGATREYLKNILDSIGAYTDPGSIPIAQRMPGQFLATNFTLTAGIRCLPSLNDASDFEPNPNFLQSVRDAIVATTTVTVPAFGAVRPTGEVPRRANSTAGEDPTLAGQTWLDGTLTSATSYRYIGTGAAAFTINRDATLGARNRVQGDINGDGVRNINDIAKLMEAANALDDDATGAALLTWAYNQCPDAGCTGMAGGQTGGNHLLIHVIGDFDGDGQFNGTGPDYDAAGTTYVRNVGNRGTTDVRYFLDGLALDPACTIGKYGPALNRRAAFIAADNAWAALNPGDNNYFNTTVANGSYAAGDARFDIVGDAAVAPGADPRGADGAVDVEDVDYVAANVHFGGATPATRDWTSTDVATTAWVYNGRVLTLDLSADMTGPTDANGDGVWELEISAADIAAIEAKGCTAASQGDSNRSGAVDFDDINCFVAALVGVEAWNGCNGGSVPFTLGSYYCANDVNRDGSVNFDDIPGFVACLTGACP